DGSISVKVSISSLQHSDITVWDDWDEDPKVKERVEMSFESLRLEKEEQPRSGVGFAGVGLGVGVGGGGVGMIGEIGGVGGVNSVVGSRFLLGSPRTGRSVSGGSTPGACGWASGARVMNGGSKCRSAA